MIPPSDIWLEAANNKHVPPEDIFTPSQKLTLDFLHEHFLDLYKGTPKITHSTNHILALSQHLSVIVNSNQKAECFNFLARGFELGNQKLEWDVPLAPVYITIKHEQNYATHEKFLPTNLADEIVSAISDDITSGLPKNNAELLGQILVSLIIFGGLINKKLVQPFWDSLLNRDYYQTKGIFWIEMSVNPGTNATHNNPISHRLVPDHLTRLLLYRLQDRSQKLDTCDHKPWACASAYLKRLDLQERLKPTSLQALLNIALARYIRLLPHNLVGFASGNLPATSLPLEVWLRCLTGRAIPVSKPTPMDEDQRPIKVRKIFNNENCKTATQLELMAYLLKKLRRPKTGKTSISKGKTILEDFRNDFGHSLSPTFQLLIYWAERLLERRTSQLERRNIEAIKVSSLYRYLSGIGADLLAAAGDLNPLEIDPGDLELIYEETVHRKPKEALTLRQFHSFLTAYYNLPVLEWTEMTSYGGTAVTCVSANLIDEKTYTLLLQSFGWGKAPNRWERLRIIAVILMFRCGLRPSEIRSIRLIDIQGVTRYEILIRITALNDPKSISGVRRIPISELLTNEELCFLLDFYKKRSTEDYHFGGGLFLAHPFQKKGLLPDDKLYNPVRKILKEITQDETVVLYHLRHSFLSWLCLQAQLRDSPYYTSLKETISIPSINVNMLLAPILKNEPWNRKINYIFSTLIGHASPLTTNKHYNHLLDLTLGYHLQKKQNSISLNHETIMNLTGRRRSQAFKYLTANNASPLLSAVNAIASKHSGALEHPLVKKSRKVKAKNHKIESHQFPPWDDAVLKLLELNKGHSKISQKDWSTAAQVYEHVRSFDGRKIKSAEQQIINAYEYFNTRWGGITFGSYIDAKKFLNFIKDCKIKRENILIVHHPKYGQSETNKSVEIKKWSRSIDICLKNFISGEFSGKELKSLKGQITIKIINDVVKSRKKRAQRTSVGFKLITQFLYQMIKE